MTNKIDVHDLPQEEVRFVQELVELIREKIRKKKTQAEEKGTDEITFNTHSSDVIGKLTRREIYDHL